MAISKDKTVTINDTQYKLSDLSEEAQTQLNNLRKTDAEIDRLQDQLSIAKTARMSYGRALTKALPKVSKESLQ